MKEKIHPQYNEDLQITCACGNVIIAGSTRKELKTELCSACHPFYTGKQKLVDTAGRVDKFMAKMKKTQEIKDKKAGKKIPVEMEELPAGPEQAELPGAEVEEIEAPKAKKTKAAAKKAPAKKTTKKKE